MGTDNVHLLRDVEKFLRHSAMPATRFGREAVRDPRFVSDLRRGREPRPRTIERVRAFGVEPMMKLALSPAAASLLRALLARAGIDRDRILLTEFRSTDWQSLTFIGERHEIVVRIPGPDAGLIAGRLADGLSDAEFAIPGQILADIGLERPRSPNPDGSVTLHIEALTIAE